MFVELLGGILGSAAGGAAGALAGGGGGGDPFALATMQNSLLDKAKGQSVNQAQQAFGNAGNVLTSSKNASLQYLNKAKQDANQQGLFGFQLARGLAAPYSTQGYNALDRYSQLLGLPTPQGGSANLANALYNDQMMRHQLYNLTGNPYASAPQSPGARPNYSAKDITPFQIQQYILQNTKKTGGDERPNQYSFGSLSSFKGKNAFMNDPNAQEWARQQLFSSSPQQQALNNYNNRLNLYNNYNKMVQQVGYTPEQQQLVRQYYNGGLFS